MLKKVFESYAKFLVAHPYVIIILSLLLIGVGMIGFTQLSMEPELDMYDKDSDTYKDYEIYLDNFAGGERVFITVESPDPTSIENLQTMSALEKDLMSNDGIIAVSSVSSILSEAIQAVTGDPTIPNNQFVVDQALSSLPPDTLRSFIPSNDTALIIVEIESKEELGTVEDALTNAGFSEQTDTNIVGNAVVFSKIADDMQMDMGLLIGLAVILMIIILGLIFGHVRLRFLPLVMVIVGLILTMGLMGFIKLPVTMVIIAVFPLLIGLGIDYSINYQNRIQEDVEKEGPKNATITSIVNIGPPLVIALIATILGFLTLQFSQMIMLKQFGVVVVIGVVMCFVVSLSLLPAVLHIFYNKFNTKKKMAKKTDNNVKGSEEKIKESFIEKHIGKITKFSSKHPIPIISIAIVLAILGMIGGEYVEIDVNQENMVPQDMEELNDLEELREMIGGTEELIVIIQTDDVTDPNLLQWVLQTGQRIQDDFDAITNANSVANFIAMNANGTIPQDSETTEMILNQMPENMRTSLMNDDGSIILIRLTLNEPNMDKVSSVIDEIDEIIKDSPEGADALVSGQPLLTIVVREGMINDRNLLTIIGCVLILVGLLIIYRRPIKASIPLVPIILVIGWSLGLMYILNISLNPLTIGLGALIFGLGAEYTILLMERYYEERDQGQSPEKSIEIASKKIGRAIFSSGLTTMGGFAALILSSYPFIQSFGMVILIDVGLCLLSTIIVLPPLIVAIDKGYSKIKAKRKRNE